MTDLQKWFDRQRRTLEDQPWWKAVEQVAHAAIAGISGLAVLIAIDLFQPLDLWPSLAVTLTIAFVGQPFTFWSWGLAREIRQNWGDEPDDTTLFRLGPLPVNLDMGVDMLAYLAGGVIAGVASLFV